MNGKTIKYCKYLIILTAILMLLFIPTKALADVGSFESYDSGWDSDYD